MTEQMRPDRAGGTEGRFGAAGWDASGDAADDEQETGMRPGTARRHTDPPAEPGPSAGRAAGAGESDDIPKPDPALDQG